MLATGTWDALVQLLVLLQPLSVISGKTLNVLASQSQHRVLFLSWHIFTNLRGRKFYLCASTGTSKWGFASAWVCYLLL